MEPYKYVLLLIVILILAYLAVMFTVYVYLNSKFRCKICQPRKKIWRKQELLNKQLQAMGEKISNLQNKVKMIIGDRKLKAIEKKISEERKSEDKDG